MTPTPDFIHAHFAAYPVTHRPSIALKDGTSLSVQASSHHYSWPKADNADAYVMVEVGSLKRLHGIGRAEPRLRKDAYFIYPFASVAKVNWLIARKGGVR